MTFGIEVQVSAHYSQWFCMVKGRQRGRSVGGQGHLWFGTCQKCWPKCPTLIRALTAMSVPQLNLAEPLGCTIPQAVRRQVSSLGAKCMDLSHLLM